jgi:hypothetical protein
VTAPLASPNTGNYQVAKGIISIKIPPVTGTPQLLGNVSKCSLTFATEILDHFSGSASGIKVRDAVVPSFVKATLEMTLDEISLNNLLLAVTGTNTGGTIAILALPDFSAEVIIQGTNAVGPKYQWDLYNVLMLPSKAIQMISTTWNELEINGEVLIDQNLNYGTVVQL